MPDPFHSRFRSPLASDTARGIFWMVVSCAAFTALWAVIRYGAQHIHPYIQFAARTLIGLAILAPSAIRMGRAMFVSASVKQHMLRGFLSTLAGMCTFQAVSMAPLADVTAVSFSGPLFTSAGAILFLKEKVHARRILALVVGAIGVIIMLRPGSGGVGTGLVLAIVGSMLIGGVMLIVKKTSATDPPSTITFLGFLFTLPGAGLAAMTVWSMPSLAECGWLLAIGSLATFGQVTLARAFSLADATMIMPFDFTRLLMAVPIGWLLFEEIPDAWTVTGGLVVLTSTIYMAHRESVRARETKLNP